MDLSRSAVSVLEKRYLQKDECGNPIERIDEMFSRVSGAVAGAESKWAPERVPEMEKAFYTMMVNLDFLPNSPTLMNAGRPLGQLSGCFVLPVEDSMEAIFEAVKQAAIIHKSGGGTGFSFSRLRPKGSTVRTTGGVASGPVSFMRVFNMATEAVKQGGTRRGANMGILRVDHPDILEFIDCKQQNTDIINFNMSVGVTDAFMKAVLADSVYDIIDPFTGSVVEQRPARDLFMHICRNAWKNGEPGIVFLDKINAFNPVPSQGRIEGTNPCGEQPLLPYESCNLGSINLSNFMDTSQSRVDYTRLESVIKLAVRFLDNVIEINNLPLGIIEETTKLTRKIGLGVMGFADALLKFHIPYNSEEARALAEELMEFVTKTARKASEDLAVERGAFPLFHESIYKDGPPLRNAAITTIAPTGTLSLIAGCSSGVEPNFAYVYTRKIMDDERFLECNRVLKEELEELGFFYPDFVQQIADTGTLNDIDGIPDSVKRAYLSAHDINPIDHIKMQASFQKFTDNAVSKTVNMPHDATVDAVYEIYMAAYTLGCKGVTVYRDGSRDGQTLSAGHSPGEQAGKQSEPIRPRPREETLTGITRKMPIGCGNLYVTVNYDEHGICEVFTSTGKAGGCPSQSEATARLASIALRSGIELEYILKQLEGIRCPSTLRQNGRKCTSCPDAIASVIRAMWDAMQGKNGPLPGVPCYPAADGDVAADVGITVCPECGQELEHAGGCVSCNHCGYSGCG